MYLKMCQIKRRINNKKRGKVKENYCTNRTVEIGKTWTGDQSTELFLYIYPVGSSFPSYCHGFLYIASIKSKVTIRLFWKKTSAQTNHMRYLKFVCKNWYLCSNENTSFNQSTEVLSGFDFIDYYQFQN